MQHKVTDSSFSSGLIVSFRKLFDKHDILFEVTNQTSWLPVGNRTEHPFGIFSLSSVPQKSKTTSRELFVKKCRMKVSIFMQKKL